MGVHRALRSKKQEKEAKEQDAMEMGGRSKTGTHNGAARSKPRKCRTPGLVGGWIIIYVVGTFIGAVALFSLVHETYKSNHEVRVLTDGFVGLATLTAVIAVIGIALAFALLHLGHIGAVAVGVFFFVLLSVAGASLVFYNDLVLAAIAHDWWGRPSSDVKYVYWLYFAAKKIQMVAL
jgi:hypothetical protein